MKFSRTENCGVYAIAGLHEFIDAPRKFFKEIDTKSAKAGQGLWKYPGMILFSDATSKEPGTWTHTRFVKGKSYGDRLRDFIQKHGLGVVTETDWVHNPNSGNDIKHFQWAINPEALEKFIAEMPRTEAAFAEQYK